MNIEQLAYLLRRANIVLESNDVENVVSNTAQLLEQLSSNAGNADLASQLEQSIEKLKSLAESAKSNVFSPREVELLEEMGAQYAVPSNLYYGVSNLVLGHDVFAASNANKVKNILKDVQRIKRTYSSFESVVSELSLESVLGEFAPTENLGAELSFFCASG